MIRTKIGPALLAAALPLLLAGPAPASLISYSSAGDNTGTGFGSPVVETFNGFGSSISLADSSSNFSGGTLLGSGTFKIGVPGDGAAPIFPTFANEAGNPGLTLIMSQTTPNSFVATGSPFTSLGFRVSDLTSGDIILTAFADTAGTVPLGSFTFSFGAGGIPGNDSAFIGVTQGVGGPIPFARLDVTLANGLLSDSVQIDGVRATNVVPEPASLALWGFVGLVGLYVARSRVRKMAVA